MSHDLQYCVQILFSFQPGPIFSLMQHLLAAITIKQPHTVTD